MQAPAAQHELPAQGCAARPEREERKVGVVSGTHADVFDEANEHKHDKWVAIFISILAVQIAIAETGNNDSMKIAQQAGIQVNDNYAFDQAKVIRQGQLKLASDQLELKMQETPNPAEPARKLLETKKADYDKEILRLEFNRRNGRKELLARAETARTCGTSRSRSIRSSTTPAPSCKSPSCWRRHRSLPGRGSCLAQAGWWASSESCYS